MLKNSKNLRAKISNITLFILALVTFSFIYKACSLFPLFADDWTYAFIWHSDQKITNISDIIQSQYKHYLTWGGRSVVHSIVQFLLLIKSHALRCTLNALIYVCLTIVIFKIASNKKDSLGIRHIAIYMFIISALWVCSPTLSGVTMWITGSSNYMWGTLIVLLFTYPYINSLKDENKDYNKTKYYFLFILGIIAGWCNEASSLSVVAFLVLYLFLSAQTKSLKKTMISGSIGFIIGTLVMFIAPGNYARLNSHLSSQEARVGLIQNLSNNLASLYKYTFIDSHIYLVLTLLFLLLLYYLVIQKGNIKDLNVPISIGFIGFIAVSAMLFSPQFPLRTMFFPFICLLTSTVSIFYKINVQNKLLKVLKMAFIFTFFGVYLWDANGRINSLKYISAFWEERIRYTEKNKERMITDIVFEEAYPLYKRQYTNIKYHIYDLSEDSTNWVNQAYSKYYGVNSVRVETKKDSTNNK